MSDPISRRHATGSVTPDQALAPELTYGERARTLIHLGRVGALSTMSRQHPGWPFGSVMPYALDEAGRPLFLISSMAMHTQNLQADPHASLLVTQSDGRRSPNSIGRSGETYCREPCQCAENLSRASRKCAVLGGF